jgi:sulfur carrier protein
MTFELNGRPQETPDDITVRVLLESFDLHRRRVAVAINASVIPKSHFDEVRIHEGDSVEVIQAVGGG